MNTIILTGAIIPSFPVKRKAPYIRLVDYLCAIRHWLNVDILDHVIYCDASGCHIPEYVFMSDKFESLSMDSSEHAKKFEAGRAEAECLHYVLDHCREKPGSFFKCTGRYYVKNISEIVRFIRFYDNVPIYLRKWYRPRWADTRFFWMKTDTFQENIVPRIQELTGVNYQGHVIESLFYEYVSQNSSFPEPYIIGRSAHLDMIYIEDFTDEDKRDAKSIIDDLGMQTFCPGIDKHSKFCE